MKLYMLYSDKVIEKYCAAVRRLYSDGIRLLKSGYKKSEQFYKDFLDDNIKNNDDYF